MYITRGNILDFWGYEKMGVVNVRLVMEIQSDVPYSLVTLIWKVYMYLFILKTFSGLDIADLEKWSAEDDMSWQHPDPTPCIWASTINNQLNVLI